ncbi:NnrS family protein [Thalassotalea sp. HSM 43]|uniref:NnrS family protein n=1 Tax=Thalassotalea sp. HSM 43 TaxID=2552945 RepID=UPI001080AECB|nr:NnrS family protein [Thalassotalea sp. HSM 43]QBY03783.1 NnrS family protein [Thalassotalea sp. HSM 43]
MQITDLTKEQNIAPFFRLGFRPFFTLGAFFSCLALIVWVGVLSGSLHFEVYGGGYFYHIHEMVFGFVIAIVVGFLLTAVQNWTGIRSINGKPLMWLVLLWFLGRLVMLMPSWFGATLAAIIDVSFLLVAAIYLAIPIIKVKQTRNLFFIPMLLFFALLNTLMHSSIQGYLVISLKTLSYAVLLLITLLMSIMAGRVTPMFTANGTGTQKVAPWAWLEWSCTISLLLLIVVHLTQANLMIANDIVATLFVISAALQAIRWIRWRPWITLSVPLLWSLHASMFFVWFGLLTIGIGLFMQSVALSHIWHLLTIGGMGGLILAMISRVSLGHTGQPLKPSKIMSLAFLLVIVAALVRGFGPWLAPQLHMLFINLSSLCWLIAFTIFVIKYAPMLMQPRKDGRPG